MIPLKMLAGVVLLPVVFVVIVLYPFAWIAARSWMLATRDAGPLNRLEEFARRHP